MKKAASPVAGASSGIGASLGLLAEQGCSVVPVRADCRAQAAEKTAASPRLKWMY